MSRIVLSPEEITRFASWLEQEAKDIDALINQLERLGALSAYEATVNKEKIEAAAYRLVAHKLRPASSNTTGPKDELHIEIHKEPAQ